MRTRYLGLLEIRLEAWRDRKANVPSPSAKALSEVERRIQGAVNSSIRTLEDAHAKKSEPLKASLRASEEQLVKVELPEWEAAIQRTDRRQEDVTFGALWSFVIMFGLIAGETAFNLLAFSASPQETRIFSMGLGLAVSIAIPMLAHATGIAARQYQPMRRKLLWVVSWSIAALAIIWVVNILRASHLNAEASATGGTGLFTSAWIYFGLNAGVFAAAALVTYFSKDSDAAFVKAKGRVEKRKAQISKLEGRLSELKARLRHQANRLRDSGQQAISVYRTVNRRGRKEVPAYFDDDSDPNNIVKFVELEPEPVDELPSEGVITAPKRPRLVRSVRPKAGNQQEKKEGIR